MSSAWLQKDNGNENPVVEELVPKFLLAYNTTVKLFEFCAGTAISNKASFGTPIQPKDSKKEEFSW